MQQKYDYEIDMMTRSKKIIILAAIVAVLAAIPVSAKAAMYFNVYGSLTSGDWNPLKTDVAATYGFVGWEDANVKDNFGYVLAEINWKDKNENLITTTRRLNFTNVAEKTDTVTAESGNDNSKATSYHEGYLHDNLSNRDFSGSGSYSE